MIQNFLECFLYEGQPARLVDDNLLFGTTRIKVRNGIPRFTPDSSYSSGNFERLRLEHAKLQLDSVNGTVDRADTLRFRTGWPQTFFQDKLVLECGCGAGPDSEVLLSMGAKLLSVDLAGVDVAHANIGDNPRHCLVQASITELPLKKKSFDVVFCHRVLQHTPDPEATLRHILQFVKLGGAVFVHSYARTIYQLLRWKYILRPITRRFPPDLLYKMIRGYAPVAYKITETLNRTKFGQVIAYGLVPFLNYSHLPQFAGKSDEWHMEFAIHDTFDALSPPYDRPMSASKMLAVGQEVFGDPLEVLERKTITVLRTPVAALDAEPT